LAQTLLVRVERLPLPAEQLPESASPLARSLPEQAVVRQLERRASPVSRA